MKNQSTYSSSDLPLVTTLALEFPIISIDHANPKRILFNFKNTSELQARTEDYWKGILSIEPQKFYLQMKHLKSQIYGGRSA